MKSRRQEKIKEIIEQYNIETQDELAEKLQEAGFSTTQATISRDIREMKLTKLSYPGGRQKYIVLQNKDYSAKKRYKRILAESILTTDVAQNIIVIHTVAGMAMASAAAIDALGIKGILGTIAGDDTVMCVARDHNIALDAISELGRKSSAKDQEDEEK